MSHAGDETITKINAWRWKWMRCVLQPPGRADVFGCNDARLNDNAGAWKNRFVISSFARVRLSCDTRRIMCAFTAGTLGLRAPVKLHSHFYTAAHQNVPIWFVFFWFESRSEEKKETAEEYETKIRNALLSDRTSIFSPFTVRRLVLSGCLAQVQSTHSHACQRRSWKKNTVI